MMLPLSTKGTPVWRLPPGTFEVVTGWDVGGFIPRTMEFLDSLQIVPWDGDPRASHCHEADVAILGANSLLGAFALLRASRLGQRVFWGVQPGLDGFPVGLFEGQAMRETVVELLKKLGAAEIEATSQTFEVDLATLFVEMVTADTIVPRRTAAFCMNTQSAGDRQVIMAVDGFEALAPTDGFSAPLHQKLTHKAHHADLSIAAAGRHAVIAKKIVLTSMVAPFGEVTAHMGQVGERYEWACPAIEAVGTARTSYELLGPTLSAIAEDIGRLSD